MLRKLIKVGSSTAVIVPKDVLKEQHVSAGDMVNVTISKPSKGKPGTNLAVDPQVVEWTNRFIHKYRPLLKKLASS